ncbi:MAG: helix-turn-helix transcriptional regulator [Streptosporangiaceae bacterium]
MVQDVDRSGLGSSGLSDPGGMLGSVSSRVSSPSFVGRADQLDALDRAFESATHGESRAVFVGGEAGIGKTRLAKEFVARARDSGAHVLIGGCLELGSEGLPYAPFAAALRGLVRAAGPEAVTSLVHAGALARLLPELGRPVEEPDARGRLYEHVLLLLERLAEQAPVVLLIEDAHWADRSTRELLIFLVHNLGAVRVLLVVTFRSDELHRRHPLRPLLAELDRARPVSRLELPRLQRGEVADQCAAILGQDPDAALVERVYSRSEGNPLFVEADLNCPEEGGLVISDSLRDLLLRGVEGLPDETQRVLRVASAGGVRVAHPLLAAVTGLDDASLAEVLRPAVDGHVIVADGDDYAFRHALIREAVHDELLPGEHAAMHLRFAEALDRDRSILPGVRRAVEVAYHWHAAHDTEHALVAAWHAAGEAAGAYAHAERLTLLERVLELWDRLPEAEWLIGTSHVGVLEQAVDAAYDSGEQARGVSYATAALGEIDDQVEPLREAALLQRRGKMTRNIGRGDGMADFRAAVRLASAEPTSEVRAKVLAAIAGTLMTQFADDEAAAFAEEALRVARAVGDKHAEVSALITLAVLETHRRGLEAGLAGYAEAREIAAACGDHGQMTRLAINESNTLTEFGQHERAVEVARGGWAHAEMIGLERTQGAFLACNSAEPLLALGRWEEAEETVTRVLDRDPPPTYAAFLLRIRAELALARGDVDGAARLVARSRALGCDVCGDPQLALPVLRLEAAVALARGRPDDALALVTGALSDRRPFTTGCHIWPLLSLGASAGAEAVERAASLRDAAAVEAVERGLAALDAEAEGVHVAGPVEVAHHAVFVAERARARREPDGAAWEAAVGAWRSVPQPYDLARALPRAAEALLRAGETDAAADRLREAYEIASGLGAALLVRDIEALGRRARLAVGVVGYPAAEDGAVARGGDADDVPKGALGSYRERLGLTEREVEVLDLLVAGNSNRQIATELFISPKTASVHVSNIIAKLGVSTRLEAASMAYRLGLGAAPVESA